MIHGCLIYLQAWLVIIVDSCFTGCVKMQLKPSVNSGKNILSQISRSKYPAANIFTYLMGKQVVFLTSSITA